MYNIGERMRKGIVCLLFVLFVSGLLAINIINAPSGTAVSVDPNLIQDSQLKPTASDVNSYPSTYNNTATVTSPANAYDKSQTTFATITPTATAYQYFNVKVFNATTIKSYSYIDINMNYSVLIYRAYYRLTLCVGSASASYTLQTISVANVTTPALRTWTGLIEPNDGLWSATDLNNLVIKVEVRKLLSTGTFTCTFKEYEAWATIQGDGFAFRVNVSDVPTAPNDCYAWQVNITYNPLVLQCVTAYEGPFLSKVGATFTLNVQIDNEAGWVLAGTAFQSYDVGATGSGLLATVAFKVIAQGNSALAFVTDTTKLRTWDGIEFVPIPHTTVDGYFRSIQGDVNGDTKVNALDLYLLGRAYGSTPAQPTQWNVNCDFNKDNVINNADLITLKQNYGY
jgi:hypothetical protein